MKKTTWVNLENIMLGEGGQSAKTTYYDSIYMKYPEQTDPQRLKIKQWVPRATGKQVGKSDG